MFIFDVRRESPQRYYGFVENIEAMSDDWIAVHIDAISADHFDRMKGGMPESESLGLLRIFSTRRRLRSLAEEDDDIQPGDWLLLETGNMSGRPPVWALQLEGDRFVGETIDGGQRPFRARLSSVRRLSRYSDPGGPVALGSAASPSATTARRLKQRFSLQGLGWQVAPGTANKWLGLVGRYFSASYIEAFDVGQASFNAFRSTTNDKANLYFDVGQPLWFHLHNLPSGFKETPNANAVVVLSHWDTDHYAYGRQNSAFHSLPWIAPEQTAVGPNAFKFAKKLHDAGLLLLIGRGRSSRHRRGVRLIRCNGKNLNGSGLALHFKSASRSILLSGDAEYDEIPSMRGIRLCGLQIPHHGGKLNNTVSIPQGHGVAHAIASCGLPNRYGHPSPTTINDHSGAGWKVSVTAEWGGAARGNKRV